MQKLNMVDADTLLYQPLDKPRFVVDGLIPTGLILFCGSQKIGKSWLMLKLCLCVSAAETLLMCVGGTAILGDGNTGGRCAVPVP